MFSNDLSFFETVLKNSTKKHPRESEKHPRESENTIKPGNTINLATFFGLKDGKNNLSHLRMLDNTQPKKNELTKRQLYDNIFALNNSAMEYLKKSPQIFNDYIHGKLKQSNKRFFLFGSAFHSFILEREVFNTEYYVIPKDGINNNNQILLFHDREFLTWEEYITIKEMEKSLRKHGMASYLLDKCDNKEYIHTWIENDSGAKCKGMFDGICNTKKFIIDLKTTMATNQDDFYTSIFKYNYDRQAAFYLDGANFDIFYFVVVSKVKPYLVFTCKFEKDGDIIKMGREKYKPLCKLYVEYTKNQELK